MLGLGSPAGSAAAVRTYEIAAIMCASGIALAEPLIITGLQKSGVDWWWSKVPFPVRGLAYAGMTLFVMILGGYTQKFIYFDF